jgi:hypothetical protein
MVRRALLVLAAVAFASVIPRPALADRILKVTIRAVKNEPFRITACSGSVRYSGGGFHPEASYTNGGQKAIKAIKVRFVLEDDFDTRLEEVVGLDGDGMEIGGSNHGAWDFFSNPLTATELVCEAYAAKFTDGTVWEASPGASELREQPKNP